ncbi:DUF494 family protein [Ampullimonas aquatilis]|uniref:DUF494 family protein n=1 Tax=Ampullimonas aquatilis TaxID=1341549 RepID=UPI003C73C5CB
MFDILVYLFENYYRPDACPDSDVLVKKLAAVGFDNDDIFDALSWLRDLNEARASAPTLSSPTLDTSIRIYSAQEYEQLGTEAIGFLTFLDSGKLLNPSQREFVIDRALALGESPMPLDKLKVIVLMVLWSQGEEPDMLIFDELLDDEEDGERTCH